MPITVLTTIVTHSTENYPQTRNGAEILYYLSNFSLLQLICNSFLDKTFFFSQQYDVYRLIKDIIS